MSRKNIRVDIPESALWKLGNPVHQHVYVGNTLRKAGIPVIGGLEMQGIEYGRLTFWNGVKGNEKVRCYEWTHDPEDEL